MEESEQAGGGIVVGKHDDADRGKHERRYGRTRGEKQKSAACVLKMTEMERE